MYKQVGIGNFAADTDEENERAARKYAALVEAHMREFFEREYPDAEIKIEISVENVSGCITNFSFTVDADETTEFDAEKNILREHEDYCALLEREGTIYE
jgi:hypothetical protein